MVLMAPGSTSRPTSSGSTLPSQKVLGDTDMCQEVAVVPNLRFGTIGSLSYHGCLSRSHDRFSQWRLLLNVMFGLLRPPGESFLSSTMAHLGILYTIP